MAYVQPSRRPADGRFGENPNRLFQHHQFQVILKPAPKNVQELYLDSLRAIGIDPLEHDLRFVEDDWESPTLGAWGLGWEVWCDGMEITQFTYFQQCGGFECRPVAARAHLRARAHLHVPAERRERLRRRVGEGREVPRGLPPQRGGDEQLRASSASDPQMLFGLFDAYEKECKRLLERELPLPAYDYALKCSHAFNLLDARGAICVTERANFIKRVRDNARALRRGLPEDARGARLPAAEDGVDGRRAAAAARGQARAATTGRPRSRTEARPVARICSSRSAPRSSRASFIEPALEELAAPSSPSARRRAAQARRGPHLRHAAAAGACWSKRRRGRERRRHARGARPVGEGRLRHGRQAHPRGDEVRRGARAAGRRAPAGRRRRRASTSPRRSTRRGAPAEALLPERARRRGARHQLPKSMRWGDVEQTFARPVQWLVALLGRRCSRSCFADVKSGRMTLRAPLPRPGPHRAAAHPRDYAGAARAGPRASPTCAERRSASAPSAGARRARPAAGDPRGRGAARPGHRASSSGPPRCSGSFEERHLDLPPEVLVQEMTRHQRYFSVVDGSGKLLPALRRRLQHPGEGPGAVAARLRARAPFPAGDGRFFFDEDRKVPLAERVAALERVVWQGKLGTYAEKVAASGCSPQPSPARWDAPSSGGGGPRGAPGQGRPDHRDGGRVPRAAGSHGPGVRARLRRASRRSPWPSRTTTCPRGARTGARRGPGGPGRHGRPAGHPRRALRAGQAAHRLGGSVRAPPGVPRRRPPRARPGLSPLAGPGGGRRARGSGEEARARGRRAGRGSGAASGVLPRPAARAVGRPGPGRRGRGGARGGLRRPRGRRGPGSTPRPGGGSTGLHPAGHRLQAGGQHRREAGEGRLGRAGRSAPLPGALGDRAGGSRASCLGGGPPRPGHRGRRCRARRRPGAEGPGGHLLRQGAGDDRRPPRAREPRTPAPRGGPGVRPLADLSRIQAETGGAS